MKHCISLITVTTTGGTGVFNLTDIFSVFYFLVVILYRGERNCWPSEYIICIIKLYSRYTRELWNY